jgi:hypothetical protein
VTDQNLAAPPLATTPAAANDAVRAALSSAWSRERVAARRAAELGDRASEWRHLERAHIVSQPLALLHMRTHAVMFRVGFRRRDRREVVGQLVRLLLAGPGSWTGRYPVGNTGGADVSAFVPMPVPYDLRAVLDGTDTEEHR